MAQRLVRVLCPRCKEAYQPTEDEMALIGITPPSPPLIKGGIGGVFYRKAGCEECLSTGYIGRKGIYELLDVDDDIRRVILQGGDSRSVRTEADRKGMKRMISDGADKVLQGITTIEEVLRVTQEE